nr:MAG TPA: hypothetical protein [Caudoviricetes sp.]
MQENKNAAAGLVRPHSGIYAKDRRTFPAVFCIKRVSALRFPDCAGG